MSSSINLEEGGVTHEGAKPLTCPNLATFSLAWADYVLYDVKPEGPTHKAWRERLQTELAKELRAEGFTKNEIEKIVVDALSGLWGILKNLWRLYKALRAYKRAKKTVGPEPAWDE